MKRRVLFRATIGFVASPRSPVRPPAPRDHLASLSAVWPPPPSPPLPSPTVLLTLPPLPDLRSHGHPAPTLPRHGGPAHRRGRPLSRPNGTTALAVPVPNPELPLTPAPQTRDPPTHLPGLSNPLHPAVLAGAADRARRPRRPFFRPVAERQTPTSLSPLLPSFELPWTLSPCSLLPPICRCHGEHAAAAESAPGRPRLLALHGAGRHAATPPLFSVTPGEVSAADATTLVDAAAGNSCKCQTRQRNAGRSPRVVAHLRSSFWCKGEYDDWGKRIILVVDMIANLAVFISFISVSRQHVLES